MLLFKKHTNDSESSTACIPRYHLELGTREIAFIVYLFCRGVGLWARQDSAMMETGIFPVKDYKPIGNRRQTSRFQDGMWYV